MGEMTLKKARNLRSLHTVILLAGLGAFFFYYAIHIFRFPWYGDIHLYIAATHSLYRDLWPPEAMYSPYLSPYLVMIAIVGKSLGVSPYRALQLAGLANLVLYAGAITLFFRNFSSLPKSPWPPLVFLVVSLFLRSQHHDWSSETDYMTLRVLQAYPSLLGWSLAIISFVLVEWVVRGTNTRAALAALTLLIAFQLLTHALTASWVIGIVGLRALYVTLTAAWQTYRRREKWSSSALREALATASQILGALLAGIGLALSWPYYSPLLLLGLTGIPENAPFGASPISVMPATYALGLLAAIPAVRAGRHRFWLVAFVATYCAWATFRIIGIDLGDRYVYFMAFCPQLFVADAAARAVERLFPSMACDRRPTRLLRVAGAAYLALLVAALVSAPILGREYRARLPSLQELWAARPTERAFYERWEPLRAALGPADVVMMPQVHAAYDIAAVTAAKVVAVPYAFSVPDFKERTLSVERFFTRGTSATVRARELDRWRANKVVLVGPALALEREMESLFGVPLGRDSTRIVFDARRRYGVDPAPTPSRIE